MIVFLEIQFTADPMNVMTIPDLECLCSSSAEKSESVYRCSWVSYDRSIEKLEL